MMKKNRNRLQFGYICPTKYLRRYVPQHATFHLCLAHLCEDPEYCDFYRGCVLRGDMVVMDNSAFEFGESLNPHMLLDLVERSGINPYAIVAPDYPGQPAQKTLESLAAFHELVPKRYKVMGVPQSVEGDWDGWLDCYKTMVRRRMCDLVGLSILGVPNAAKSVTGTDDASYNRVWAVTQLNKLWQDDNGDLSEYFEEIRGHTTRLVPKPWHHLLGASSPSEVRLQTQLGLADSMDSSSPIWHGMLGVRYDNNATGLKYGKSKVPVDFNVDKIGTADDLSSIRRLQLQNALSIAEVKNTMQLARSQRPVTLPEPTIEAIDEMVAYNINYIENACQR